VLAVLQQTQTMRSRRENSIPPHAAFTVLPH